jgi:chromate transporter
LFLPANGDGAEAAGEAWKIRSSSARHPVYRAGRVSPGTPIVPSEKPSFATAARFWLKLGFISFGGPTGQIAIMHAELVEKRRWISESRFLHALNFCMLLPGPEAQQLATYTGWALHGTWGGVVAGALFVLPSAILLWALSWLALAGGDLPGVAAVFQGLQPAVMAIVAAAIIRIGSKALKRPLHWLIAAVAFVAIYFLQAPFIAIVAGAGVMGLLAGRYAPGFLAVPAVHGEPGEQELPPPSGPYRTLRVVAGCLALWMLPLALIGLLRGRDDILFQQGVFFSKAALVTFGGAYAVLPYVAQQAVETFGWVTTREMMTGLALAETTPGPLIMVLQFVGFAGAWHHPGGLSPLVAGTLGAAITTWCTFLPSFLFVLTGAPHIERLRKAKALSAALSAITAAVVGVVLNLAVWFGLHAVAPEPGRIDYFVLGLSVVFFLGLWKGRWSILAVVGAGALAGLIGHFLGYALRA